MVEFGLNKQPEAPEISHIKNVLDNDTRRTYLDATWPPR